MGKRIKDYVKYTVSELENYTTLKKSCVKKINRELHINFPPYGLGGNFKKTLMHIISEQKIGSYDSELKGIILDIKHIKVFEQYGAIRFDDPAIHFNIKADCYVFQPEIGAVVSGVVKHISSRQIGVIIYRVFNVTIRLKDWTNLELIELDSEIEFRIKKFDLHNMMPYIEGELVAKEMPLLGSSSNHIYLHDSDDSNTSSDEDDRNVSNKKLMEKAISEENEGKPNEVFKVPKTPKRKIISSKFPITDVNDGDDDEEIVFSEIFHLNKDEVKKIEIGKKRNEPEPEVITNGAKTKRKLKKEPIIKKNSKKNACSSNTDRETHSKNSTIKKSAKKKNISDSDSSQQSAPKTNTSKSSSRRSPSVSSSEFTNSTIKCESETLLKKIKLEGYSTPQRPTSGYESEEPDSDINSSEKSTKNLDIQIKSEDDIKIEKSSTKKNKKKNDKSPEPKIQKFLEPDVLKSNGNISNESIEEKKKVKSGFKKIKDPEAEAAKKSRKRKTTNTDDDTTSKKSKLSDSSSERKSKVSPSKFKVKLEF